MYFVGWGSFAWDLTGCASREMCVVGMFVELILAQDDGDLLGRAEKSFSTCRS